VSVDAAAAGIRVLPVPTPFAVGAVNCLLIEDDPLTLVDTGPNSGTALDALARALGEHGRRIEDLELIVLTHQHVDHLGLLEILVSRSGAEVAALDLLAGWVEGFPDSLESDDRFAQELMRRHGIPDDVVTVLGQVSGAFRAYGSRGTVTRRLRDGDTLRLRDRTLEVQHRPGHSPSDTLFWDPDRRLLIAGDHLLGHISSNAIVARPLAGNADVAARPRPLLAYIDSLQRTRGLGAELVLGGHGDPVTDPAAIIDGRMKLHRRRADRILGLLAQRPLSAHQIATEIWGNVAVTQAYFTLSEVLGHLDLLIDEGSVTELDEAGLSRFARLGPSRVTA
jgi:glyoxylase-like metal-dependent hydrolase (beta-lactamase superfamily II)